MYDWDRMRYLTADEIEAKRRQNRDKWGVRIALALVSLAVYGLWGDAIWLLFVWLTIPFWL